MPQFSPVSWISIFFFLTSTLVSTGAVNWWSSVGRYSTKLPSSVLASYQPHFFMWGKQRVKN
uniref:ATP synthase F0 subunit 8 n=1 Tax=Utterbackia peninsularis TaxID=872316 RepID=F4ZG81_9BIVA|nr:ATP synthase F0 subunit 8 [Utterbackia peninsularis]ADL62590.1 ATP synthase F0 subunit 8 [Utterbackia peninsularis]